MDDKRKEKGSYQIKVPLKQHSANPNERNPKKIKPEIKCSKCGKTFEFKSYFDRHGCNTVKQEKASKPPLRYTSLPAPVKTLSKPPLRYTSLPAPEKTRLNL